MCLTLLCRYPVYIWERRSGKNKGRRFQAGEEEAAKKGRIETLFLGNRSENEREARGGGRPPLIIPSFFSSPAQIPSLIPSPPPSNILQEKERDCTFFPRLDGVLPNHAIISLSGFGGEEREREREREEGSLITL